MDNHVVIAITFNRFFISVAHAIITSVKSGNNIHGNNTNPIKYLFNGSTHPFPNIQWFYTSTGEVGTIMKSLKTKHSCGHHVLPVQILKLSAPFIISPLTYVCKKSLSLGVFPDRLKVSIIKTIFKNGDKLIISTYRPISWLTSSSRVFEKLIYSRLFTHTCMNEVLVDEQYGFKPNISTEIASYKLINEIIVAMNNKM